MALKAKRIVTRIQPTGWLIGIFGGVIPFVLGYILADGVALVIAFLSFLLLTLGRILGRRNLKFLEIDIELPRRVYAGKGFQVTAYLDNKKKWLDSYLLQISVKLLHKVRLEANANWVAGGDGAKLVKRISIPLRGTATELQGSIFSYFPLGLFSHEIELKQPCSMIVYPRLITPVEVLACGSLNDADPQRGVQMGDSMGEPRGIRAWQPGDSAKRIHWPASARSFVRGQGLRVREFDPPGFTPSNCLVMFHSHAVHGEVYRHDRFERASSLVAGTLHYLHGRQVETLFTADFLAWQMVDCKNRAQYIELLAILAQAQRAIGNELEDLQRALEESSEKVDQIVIVSDIDPDAWSESLKLPDNVLVIDIRQMRFKRRYLNTAS
jgi:uncharacterized protein (DUF58 family)